MSKIVHLKESYPPGDFAIWIVIYIELLTFGLMFLGYAFSRRADIELFNASQSVLNQASGFVDTLILITSSYFVVKALNTVKNARIENIQASNESASRWLLAAILFGIMFLINKLLEFSDIFSQGINLSTNTFFMFYLLLTMFHFMHVVLGVVILFNIRKRTKIGCYSEQNCRGIESGALYWHLVDLLWIILFPLVYILR
ncbi:MAG: cytochrome c oxidase subunit 3 family protein [Sulfurimonas sp.]|uniref:cytochrome c oxidase subunit 3 family protein n=1 Tax=Sulfurimonas sp. TaxID=2022749 RepID=UPI0026173A7E|nr:cytochrome c oxidase subunit 3 family protein [Sulfurimonas sp.]MDD3475736.1 cytochrome c oxidase subunit 3 family protein [Sulfurimonas sp.]